MRRFVRDLLLFTTLELFLLDGFLATFYAPAVANPMVASTTCKHRLLAEQLPPRAVIVGGSNVLYGIDSPTLKRRLGLNPINMRLIGGLRLDYLLNEIESDVRDGDLVVLALEYRQLLVRFGSKRSAVILAHLFENRPANVRYLSWHQVRGLADHGVIPQLGFAVRAATRRIKCLDRSWHDDPPDSNAFGDFVGHRDELMLPRVRTHRPMPRRFRRGAHLADRAPQPVPRSVLLAGDTRRVHLSSPTGTALRDTGRDRRNDRDAPEGQNDHSHDQSAPGHDLSHRTVL